MSTRLIRTIRWFSIALFFATLFQWLALPVQLDPVAVAPIPAWRVDSRAHRYQWLGGWAGIGLATTVVDVLSGTTYTFPSNVGSVTTIEIIAAGANGGVASANGGNGGAYSILNSPSYTASKTVNINVGTAANGQDTWFDGANLAGSAVGAQSGTNGGSSASGTGTTKYSGGAGGTTEAPYAFLRTGGGGGGSGAPSGIGRAGGNGASSFDSPGDGAGGGGGAGASSATAGGNGSGSNGGNGGNAQDGTAGGTGTSTTGSPGGNGSHGSGGGGGWYDGNVTVSNGGNGGNGIEWTLTAGGTVGGGGGGGGAPYDTNAALVTNGGNGGNYGGGGGTGYTGGTGGASIIVITYVKSSGSVIWDAANFAVLGVVVSHLWDAVNV